MKVFANSVVYDFAADDNFPLTAALSERDRKRDWHSVGLQANPQARSLKRYLVVIINSFRLFVHHRQIQNMVTWQQMHGLFFAAYSRFFRIRKHINLTVLTFIYKPKNGLIGRIYDLFIRFAIESKYIDRIICFSDNEAEHYRAIFPIAASKFKSTLFGVIDESTKYNITALNPNSGDGGYLFAVGRSNRDYGFLLEAMKDSPYKLVIACDSLNEQSTSSNISIRTDVSYGDSLYSLIANSYCIIVPLDDPNISSGQFVFIQAGMFGKPVIVTRTNTLKDYVINGYNGIVIDKTKEDLHEAIQHCLDQVEYKRMSRNARRHYEDTFTMSAMSNRTAELIINDLAR